MRLVDSHCHLDFEAFDADREAVLRRAEEIAAATIRNAVGVLGLNAAGVEPAA